MVTSILKSKGFPNVKTGTIFIPEFTGKEKGRAISWDPEAVSTGKLHKLILL